MTGLPEYNFPAFHAEAARWRSHGFHVENPADGQEQNSWAAYMRQALCQMLTCEAICLLPGWTHSKGAIVEWFIASTLGFNIVYHQPPKQWMRLLLEMLDRKAPEETDIESDWQLPHIPARGLLLASTDQVDQSAQKATEAA